MEKDWTKWEEKLSDLTDRVKRINASIKADSVLTAEDVYKLAECNVIYSELTQEFMFKVSKNVSQTFLTNIRRACLRNCSELMVCETALDEMDSLRGIGTHPFFQFFHANQLYSKIKRKGRIAGKLGPDSEEEAKLEKETVCLLLSVAYDIWQGKQTDVKYCYPDKKKYRQLKKLITLYDADLGSTYYGWEVHFLYGDIKRENEKVTPENKIKSAAQKVKK